MTTTAEQINKILLQYHKSYSVHGMARLKAKKAILDIIAAARVEELKNLPKTSNFVWLVDINNRIAELEGGENYQYDDVRDTFDESRAKEKRNKAR